MQRFQSAALLLASAALIAAASASCSDKPDCGSCLSTPFCGWCSRDTVSNNGSSFAQCQYVSSGSPVDWTCPAVFSHGTCKQGWDCVPGNGCVQADAGHGQYSSKTECETNAPDKCAAPKPANLTVCNVKTSQCEPCADYCSADSDCKGKGAFCQNGLCHGSTCQQSAKCTETCSADTPQILIGTWRGLQIQHSFGTGEYDMKFQSKTKGPQVLFKDAAGGVSAGSVQSDVASQGKHLTLKFTNGPMVGTTLNGAYDAWEPSDETEQMAFYFGSPGDAAPADINTAMTGKGKTVYVASRCGHGAMDCDFDSVFASEAVVPMFLEMVSDPCSAATDCTGCVSNHASHCFWCPSGPVVYKDGTKGSQCAGFDPKGKEKDWVCAKGATQTCPPPPPPPTQMFGCKMQGPNGPTCSPCAAGVTCKTDKDCGKSYCQGGVCHGSAPEGCVNKAACTDLSKHNCTSGPDTYSICDEWSKQCKPAAKGSKGAITSYECKHTCVGSKVTGTYRAISVSAKFARGEYDMSFYDDATMHVKGPTANSTMVLSLTTSQSAVEKGAMSVEGTVTKADDPSIIGHKYYIILKTDEQGNDGVAKFMFQGRDTAPVADFGSAMRKSEWIMVGCKEGQPCDFSSVAVQL